MNRLHVWLLITMVCTHHTHAHTIHTHKPLYWPFSQKNLRQLVVTLIFLLRLLLDCIYNLVSSDQRTWALYIFTSCEIIPCILRIWLFPCLFCYLFITVQVNHRHIYRYLHCSCGEFSRNGMLWCRWRLTSPTCRLAV